MNGSILDKKKKSVLETFVLDLQIYEGDILKTLTPYPLNSPIIIVSIKLWGLEKKLRTWVTICTKLT